MSKTATITSLGFNIRSNWDGDGVKAAVSDLQLLQEEMRRVSGAALKVDIVVDTDGPRGIGAARRELDMLEEKMRRISGAALQIHVHVDGMDEISQAQLRIEALNAEARDVRIGFNLNMAEYIAAELKIAHLVRDRTVRIDINHGGLDDGIMQITNNFHEAVKGSEDFQTRTTRAMVMVRLAMAGVLAAGGLLPSVFVAIGAAAATLPGIFGLALGGALLSRVQSVKDAFTGLKNTILEIGDDAVKPMVQPVLEAVDRMKAALWTMQPAIKEMFANSANLVRPLSDTLIAFAQRVMPGVNDMIRESVPLFNGIQEGVKNFATSVSIMFTEMSKATEDFGMTWNLLFTYLGRIMVLFGGSTARMAKDVNESLGDSLMSFEGFIDGMLDGMEGFAAATAKVDGGLGVFKTLGDMLRIILPAWGELYAAIGLVGGGVNDLGTGIATFVGTYMRSLADSITFVAPYINDFAYYLGKGFEALSRLNPILAPVATGIFLLNKAIGANPLVLFGVVIIAIVGYLYDLEQKTGAVSAAIRRIWDTLGPYIMPIVNSITDGFNRVKEAFSGGGNAFSSLTGPVEKISDVLSTFWEKVKQFSGMMMELMGPKLTRTWNTLKDAVSDAWNTIKPALESLGTTLGPLWEQARPFLIGFGGALVTIYSIVWDVFNNAIKPVFGAIADVIAAAVQVIKGIIQVITGVFQTIKGVIELVFNFFKTVAGLIKGIFTGDFSMFTEGLGGMGNAIKDIFGGIFNVLKGALSIIDGIWDAIYGIFKGAIGVVIGYVKGFVTGIISALDAMVGGVSGGIKNAWNAAWQGIKDVVQAVWDWIQRTWDSVINGIKSAWDGIGNGIATAWNTVWGGIKASVENSWNFIKDIWNGVSEIWSKAWNKIKDVVVDTFMMITLPIRVGLAALVTAFIVWKDIFVAVWTSVWNAIVSFVTPIWNWIESAWSRIINGIKVIWDVVSGALSAAWNTIWGGIKASAEVVWNVISGAWDRLINGIKATWDIVSGALSAAWNAVWNAIKAFVEPIWNVIESVWNRIINGIKTIWDIVSGALSAAWNTVWNAIKGVFDTIVNALKAAWDWVLGVIRQAWDIWSGAIRAAWDAVWNGIKDAAMTIWNSIKAFWDDFINGIKIIWESFKSFITDAWDRLWNGIKTVAENIWNGIKQGFTDFKDNIVSTVQGIVDKVKEIWDKITSVFQGPIDAVKGIWNGVAGAFGLPQLAIGGPVGDVQNKAAGGSIRGKGTGTSDDIPAMLSNGEHVWTAREVEAAGGHTSVERLREGVLTGNMVGDPAHFAAGGPAIPWMVGQQQVHAPALQLTSGQRNTDNGYHSKGQAGDFSNGGDGGTPEMKAFANYIADTWGRPTLELIHNPFNRNIKNGQDVGDGVGLYGADTMAGHRNHVHWAVPNALNDDQMGSAIPGNGSISSGPSQAQIDQINRAKDQIKIVMRDSQRGALTAINNAQMKYAFNPGSGGYVGQIPTLSDDYASNADILGRMGVADAVPPSGTVKQGVGAMGKLDGALAAMASSGGDIGGTVPEGERAGIIAEAMRITNTPPPSTVDAWMRGMNTLITRESNWNAGARNDWDSNAAMGQNSGGLTQTIPTTFRANMVPGYENMYAPVDNVAASINYIKGRYGSIENVQQANANMPPKGYAGGARSAAAGWSMVGENGPEMVKFAGGETVKTFDEIIAKLKETTAGNVEAIRTRIGAEFESAIKKLIEANKGDSAALRSKLETCVREAVAATGMQFNIEGSGLTTEELVRKIVPQLTAFIHQGVGRLG